MADLVERCAEAVWNRVPAGYGMTHAEAEDYARTVIAIALEEAAKAVEKMPRLRPVSTTHVKSNGPADYAAAIRALNVEEQKG
jgi:hypothetical protein